MLDNDVCLFWPPKKMVENLVKQDFLGKAKVCMRRRIVHYIIKKYATKRLRYSLPFFSLSESDVAASQKFWLCLLLKSLWCIVSLFCMCLEASFLSFSPFNKFMPTFKLLCILPSLICP